MKFFEIGFHTRPDPDLASLKRHPVLRQSLPTYRTLVVVTFPGPFQDLKIKSDTDYDCLICFEHIQFLRL